MAAELYNCWRKEVESQSADTSASTGQLNALELTRENGHLRRESELLARQCDILKRLSTFSLRTPRPEFRDERSTPNEKTRTVPTPAVREKYGRRLSPVKALGERFPSDIIYSCSWLRRCELISTATTLSNFTMRKNSASRNHPLIKKMNCHLAGLYPL